MPVLSMKFTRDKSRMIRVALLWASSRMLSLKGIALWTSMRSLSTARHMQGAIRQAVQDHGVLLFFWDHLAQNLVGGAQELRGLAVLPRGGYGLNLTKWLHEFRRIPCSIMRPWRSVLTASARGETDRCRPDGDGGLRGASQRRSIRLDGFLPCRSQRSAEDRPRIRAGQRLSGDPLFAWGLRRLRTQPIGGSGLQMSTVFEGHIACASLDTVRTGFAGDQCTGRFVGGVRYRQQSARPHSPRRMQQR